MAIQVLQKGRSALRIWSAQALPAGNNMLSEAIDIRNIDGYLAMGWTITGNGTVRFEVLSCYDGSTFLDISGDIAAGQTRTTGPDGDGKNGVSITTPPSPFIKIRATETSGANAVAITAHLYGN
jgi:hypothetical protein